MITDLPLPVSPRPYDYHYANCVFYVDGACKACAVRCPGGAITEEGHDRQKCHDWLSHLGRVARERGDEVTNGGCGLCQTKVPCEFRIPYRIEKRREG